MDKMSAIIKKKIRAPEVKQDLLADIVDNLVLAENQIAEGKRINDPEVSRFL